MFFFFINLILQSQSILYLYHIFFIIIHSQIQLNCKHFYMQFGVCILENNCYSYCIPFCEKFSNQKCMYKLHSHKLVFNNYKQRLFSASPLEVSMAPRNPIVTIQNPFKCICSNPHGNPLNMQLVEEMWGAACSRRSSSMS